ncbi:P-loop containing nucleoside triphosphate hydrolase protein [Dendrothele bispora CBS 962.96]|uniref:P-loop containing nucleoside triphosphate hydrolase protein n=1 Tax=Dendrothele bispora (strain CBS 962.96) TaxID=1314807 RepID=A0A4S8MJA1_DENBC|nr:P-loop containing nucleoside triphosphate hydrolase protein [Dendrothele bispora CBS 962.96]
MDYFKVLDSAFGQNTFYMTFNILKNLYQLHPTEHHIPILDAPHDFPLLDYLSKEGIDVQTHVRTHGKHTRDTYSLYSYSTRDQQIQSRMSHGILSFTYGGIEYTVYQAAVQGGALNGPENLYDLVFNAPTSEPGEALANAVYAFSFLQPPTRIWEYQFGDWVPNEELEESIKDMSWDDIVLSPDIKEGLKRDVENFFSSEEEYKKLGVTWKRGIILLGPPGNGKTESIKVLLKDSVLRKKNYRGLYVKTFTTHGPRGMSPQYGVQTIFSHARRHAPCVLVLEDLDAMLTNAVKSVFLNELDGLATNHGILTIATSNYPEKIDKAIINRPSRFDVKYTYELPTMDERKQFAEIWSKKVISAIVPLEGNFLSVQSNLVNVATEQTEGFSYAYLKELFVSLKLTIAHQSLINKPEKWEEVLREQISNLAKEIKPAEPKEDSEDKKGDNSQNDNQVDIKQQNGKLDMAHTSFWKKCLQSELLSETLSISILLLLLLTLCNIFILLVLGVYLVSPRQTT